MGSQESDERRARETAVALGPVDPDATLRPAPDPTNALGERTLPPIVLESDEGDGPRGRHESLRLGALLGEGGMGQVFAGVQRSLGRAVAVKVLSADGDASRRVALLHEARVTGRLEHPNIVPVHALGADASGRPVMVMKRIEGASWRAAIRDPSLGAWTRRVSQHRDALEAHVEVLLRVCDALSYAHAQGVIHRDVKPENVLLGAFGEVVLLDWGVALDTRAPMPPPSVVGTPAYMAPEMLDGDPAKVTPATDVYLLGATLHEVLTGDARHGGPSIASVLVAALRSDPVAYPAEVPRALASLANDATARDPAARPPDVASFRARLVAYLSHRAAEDLADDAARALATATDAAADPADRERALHEARFGFTQSLSAWPENPAAREGLRATYGAMVRRALDDDRPEAARALYAEWPEPDDALLPAIAAAEARAAEARSLRARAETLAREMDTGAFRGAHTAVFAMIAIVGAATTGALLRSNGLYGAPPPLRDLIALDAGALGLAVAANVLLRKRIHANVIGRRLALITTAALALHLAADLVSAGLGADTYAATPLRFLLLAWILLTASTQGIPSFALPGAAALATVVLTARAPRAINLTAMLGVVAVVASTLWLVATGRLGVSVGGARGPRGARPPPTP